MLRVEQASAGTKVKRFLALMSAMSNFLDCNFSQPSCQHLGHLFSRSQVLAPIALRRANQNAAILIGPNLLKFRPQITCQLGGCERGWLIPDLKRARCSWLRFAKSSRANTGRAAHSRQGWTAAAGLSEVSAIHDKTVLLSWVANARFAPMPVVR